MNSSSRISPIRVPSSVEFVAGDIRDRDAIARACADVDVVYHNVAQVPLAKDRTLFWSVNYDGTENLLAAARTAGVRKVVHTSSSAVFGVPRRNPVDETTEPTPMEEYGRRSSPPRTSSAATSASTASM